LSNVCAYANECWELHNWNRRDGAKDRSSGGVGALSPYGPRQELSSFHLEGWNQLETFSCLWINYWANKPATVTATIENNFHNNYAPKWTERFAEGSLLSLSIIDAECTRKARIFRSEFVANWICSAISGTFSECRIIGLESDLAASLWAAYCIP